MADEEPLRVAALHPLMSLTFSIIFQALSNIKGFNIPQIANYAFEVSLLMLVCQIAIGVAYALQRNIDRSNKDGALYIVGTILGVYIITHSSYKMDLFGWVGAVGAIVLTSYVLLKRNNIV